MDLKLKDVAKFLNVSETTVRRWLAEGKMPAYRLNNQYRFNRLEIENWVIRFRETESETAPFSPQPTDSPIEATGPGGIQQFSLYRAVNQGGVLREVPGRTKEDVIRSAMKQLSLQLNLDADVLTELLLDREKLMPTALNQGIGVPHTRDFLLSGPQDVVAVAFPTEPVNYGALDGQPVYALFFLFACDDRRHLHLLAKIAHLASQPESLSFLRSRPNKEGLLAYIKGWEAMIKAPI